MCRDQKEGWTLDIMKERDAEMKRKRECLEGDTGRKRERERRLHSREEIECRDSLLTIFLMLVFLYLYFI